eukprot:m51a1_g11081 putative cation channel sperm-associated protein 4 (393) ;mRNA; f:575711-577413
MELYGQPPPRRIFAKGSSLPAAARLLRTDDRRQEDDDGADSAQDPLRVISEDLLGRLLASRAVRWTVVAAIAANTVVIAVQTGQEPGVSATRFLTAVDSIILAFMVVEIGLKWLHGFLAFWMDGWNVFDFAIVASSAVLSIVGMCLFGDNEYFSTLGQTIFTLFIATTQDGWMDAYNSVVDDGYNSALAAVYFVVAVVIGAMVFANIIVGVTITSLQAAYEQSRMRQKLQHRSLKQKGAEPHHKALSDTHPVTRMNAVDPSAWEQQRPVEAPPLDNVPPHALRNLAMVVLSLEDNAAEFEALYAKLCSIVEEVEQINDAAAAAAAATVAASAAPAQPATVKERSPQLGDGVIQLKPPKRKRRTLSEAAARLLSPSPSKEKLLVRRQSPKGTT